MTIALVTGGSRGIGLEVCRQLAQGGATVWLTARDADRAVAAAAGLDGDVRPLALDVADPASIRAAAAAVDALDVLVNNAAAFADWGETASGAALDGARRTLEIDLFGPWAVIQAFLPVLRASEHPRIVNVSSGGGSHADPDFGLAVPGGTAASYGIAKAALNALTAKLAAELGDAVKVNSVCPGLTATAPGMEAMGARPVPDGAASVVWAATLPDDGPSGGFFRDGKPLGW